MFDGKVIVFEIDICWLGLISFMFFNFYVFVFEKKF